MLGKLQTYKLQPTKFYEKGHCWLNTSSKTIGRSRKKVLAEVAAAT